MPRVISAFKQFFDGEGNPLSGGKLLFTASGTNATAKNTYADTAETIANTNPVILDSEGRCPNVFGTGSYRTTVFDSEDQQISQRDPVPGGELSTSQWGEWAASIKYPKDWLLLDENGNIFKSLENNNENNEPATSPDWWEEVKFIEVFNDTIDYPIGSLVLYTDNLIYVVVVETVAGETPVTAPKKFYIKAPDNVTQFNASGGISKGDPAILNTNGTVSAVDGVSEQFGTAIEAYAAATGVVESAYDPANGKVLFLFGSYARVGTLTGTVIALGTAVSISSIVYSAAITYDPANAKFVICYKDTTTSIKAVVVTITGVDLDEISLGTPAAAGSVASNYLTSTYDSLNGRIVLAYWNTASTSGQAAVGVVSGTDISFGTAATYTTDSCIYNRACFDVANGKVVIAYKDSGSSIGECVVGTVSVTPDTIAFGTAVTFNAASVEFISNVYDPVSGKVILIYKDVGDANQGTAIVGTVSVSPDSISFGTETVFNAGEIGFTAAAFDIASGKVNIVFEDVSNLSYGTAISGTLDGNSISFGEASIFNSSDTNSTAMVYDSVNGMTVASYTDIGAAGFGFALAYDTGFTNVDSDNFLGFARADALDADTVELYTMGSVTPDQTGLEIGSKYYIKNDGSLSLFETDVYAGRAVKENSIIVKEAIL